MAEPRDALRAERLSQSLMWMANAQRILAAALEGQRPRIPPFRHVAAEIAVEVGSHSYQEAKTKDRLAAILGRFGEADSPRV